jgi:hypothetical protein
MKRRDLPHRITRISVIALSLTHGYENLPVYLCPSTGPTVTTEHPSSLENDYASFARAILEAQEWIVHLEVLVVVLHLLVVNMCTQTPGHQNRNALSRKHG